MTTVTGSRCGTVYDASEIHSHVWRLTNESFVVGKPAEDLTPATALKHLSDSSRRALRSLQNLVVIGFSASNAYSVAVAGVDRLSGSICLWFPFEEDNEPIYQKLALPSGAKISTLDARFISVGEVRCVLLLVGDSKGSVRAQVATWPDPDAPLHSGETSTVRVFSQPIRQMTLFSSVTSWLGSSFSRFAGGSRSAQSGPGDDSAHESTPDDETDAPVADGGVCSVSTAVLSHNGPTTTVFVGLLDTGANGAVQWCQLEVTCADRGLRTMAISSTVHRGKRSIPTQHSPMLPP